MNWPALQGALPSLFADKLPENESEARKFPKEKITEKGKMNKNKHNLPS
jgi:hypothetical protein